VPRAVAVSLAVAAVLLAWGPRGGPGGEHAPPAVRSAAERAPAPAPAFRGPVRPRAESSRSSPDGGAVTVRTPVRIADAAVATSGAYERGAHIVDPRSGRPPAGVESVTVVGPDLASADAYATAAFALGEEGPAWTAGLSGYEAMTILAGGRVLSTPGFAKHCAGDSPASSIRR